MQLNRTIDVIHIVQENGTNLRLYLSLHKRTETVMSCLYSGSSVSRTSGKYFSICVSPPFGGRVGVGGGGGGQGVERGGG